MAETTIIEIIKLPFWLINYWLLTYTRILQGLGMGGACVLKSPCPEMPTTPPSRGHLVEAECVVDDRDFAGIS